MNALNQIILEGNVVKQPEKKDFSGGKVCKIPIAVNRRYKNASGSTVDEVSYFDIATFGSLADTCEKWCPKGRGIRVVGRLKQSTWKSEDGVNHSKVEVVAEHIEFKPFFKKTDNANDDGPKSATSTNVSKNKKAKLEALAQAATDTEAENENDSNEEEEITF